MKRPSATTLLAACAVVGALAGACNSISGIGDLVIATPEAGLGGGPDEGVGEGSSGVGDAPPLEGGGADAGMADGGTDGQPDTAGEVGSDSSAVATDGANEAAGEAGTDSASEASDASSEAPADAPGDAVVEGASDAASEGASDTEAGSCVVTVPVCDAGCPIAHSDGLGQTFYDCTAWGTLNEAQALEACSAYTGSATLCANDPIGCANADEVCTTGAATCTCWDYRGMHAGSVFISTTSSCSCYVAGAPSWN
jgi:hypothetical protein